MLLLSILALTGLLSPIDAKIFRRWGGHTDAVAILSGQKTGQRLYESTARMNGVAGQARVEAHDLTFETLREALRHPDVSGEDATATRWMAGSRHILGIPISDDHGQRTLFIALPDNSAVLAIHFDPAEARGFNRPAHRLGPPSGLPDYPGAKIHWTLELDASGIALYSATVNDHPDTVRASLDRNLRQGGWQAAIAPATDDGGRHPAAGGLYIRGHALMAVQAGRSRHFNSPTQITIVQQQRGRD